MQNVLGTRLTVQCLTLCTSNEGGTCSIPGQGTKIPYADGVAKKIFFLKQNVLNEEQNFCKGKI